jgi:quercetin dioxygenase-like cupin family protein
MALHDGFEPAATSTGLTRRILLDHAIAGQKLVDRVEVRQISLAAHLEVGVHRHPCPVFGHVLAGPILFQVEGEPPRRLETGDVFYEPANTPILHFDAVEIPATFIAYFLLGTGEENVLEMLS